MSSLHHQMFLNHSLVYVLRGGSKGGWGFGGCNPTPGTRYGHLCSSVDAVCTCAIFKIYTTPVSDTSGYTGTGNNHSGFGPMHYHMHLNRSVMYYRHVRACLGDCDVPKLEQNHSSSHCLCLHNNMYRLCIAWSGGYYLTGKLFVFLYLY